jgi:hypothetical protein
MSKTIKRNARTIRTKQTTPAVRATHILFGNNAHNRTEKKRLEQLGYKVEIQNSESYDTGLGACRKQCSCKSQCKMHYITTPFEGDKGSAMGMSY